MFQKIIESSELKDVTIHTLQGGTLIAGFEVDLFDEEVYGLERTEEMLQSILRDLPTGRTLRIYLKSEYSVNAGDSHSRSSALQSIGYIKNRAYVFLEKPVKTDLSFVFKNKERRVDSVLTDFLTLKNNGIAVKPLSNEDVETILPKIGEELNHSYQTLDLGHEVVSVLRLVKQSAFGMDLSTLSHIKDALTVPYTICCTIESVAQSTAETFLRRRSKQTESSSDMKDSRKYDEAQNDLEEISLNGSKLFRFEWQCLVARNSEDYLRQDREELKRRLEPLGEIYIESVGALESFKSIYPGSAPHFTILEKDSVLVTYMPLISRGDSLSKVRISKRALAIHRKDESLTYLDVFNPTYESFSWCIFGRPGTGKSVVTNALTRALLYDPNIQVIKIDVGGSHSRETEHLGGVEKTLLLNEPTGINPFDVIKELGPSKEALQIVAGFLEVLILEEGETKLSKTMKSDLETLISIYSEKDSRQYSLQDFVLKSSDLPRKELFKRWTGNGVYGNAFRVNGPSRQQMEGSLVKTSANLLYYNFSKISQALDPDYAQGGLAAVMAQLNLEMLRTSKDKKRIVFIADETPFFIKKCFSFFNLSIANVRKEGHGFITVAQKSSHVVVDNDTGILDNSPNKIYFSLDGDEESFISRNQLSRESVEKIKSLQRVQGEFSESLFKDSHGERILKIRLSPEEYWAYTSKDEDKRRFQELRAACPSLRLEEIFKCLSLY